MPLYVYVCIYIILFFFLSWNRKALLAPFPGGEGKAAGEWAAQWRVWLPGKQSAAGDALCFGEVATMDNRNPL